MTYTKDVVEGLRKAASDTRKQADDLARHYEAQADNIANFGEDIYKEDAIIRLTVRGEGDFHYEIFLRKIGGEFVVIWSSTKILTHSELITWPLLVETLSCMTLVSISCAKTWNTIFTL